CAIFPGVSFQTRSDPVCSSGKIAAMGLLFLSVFRPHLAVSDSIEEINTETYCHPYQQPEPCIKRQGSHLDKTDQSAKNRYHRHPWCPERPFNFRLRFPEDQNTQADDDECQKGSYRDQFSQDPYRQDSCYYHRDKTGN